MENSRNTDHNGYHVYDINQVASILECKTSEVKTVLTKFESFFLKEYEILETDQGFFFTEQGVYKLSMFINSDVATENREMMVSFGKIDRKWKNRIKAFISR